MTSPICNVDGNSAVNAVTVTAGTTQVSWQASVRVTSHHNRK